MAFVVRRYRSRSIQCDPVVHVSFCLASMNHWILKVNCRGSQKHLKGCVRTVTADRPKLWLPSCVWTRFDGIADQMAWSQRLGDEFYGFCGLAVSIPFNSVQFCSSCRFLFCKHELFNSYVGKFDWLESNDESSLTRFWYDVFTSWASFTYLALASALGDCCSANHVALTIA